MSDTHPWTWTKLDPDAARGSWQAVGEFVTWLVERFDLGDAIPPCWWAHGAMVEELSALWAAWCGAYLHPDAEANAPIEWLERLATCRVRLGEWDKMGCAQRTHRDATPTGWEVDEKAFAAFVEADIARRPCPQRLVAQDRTLALFVDADDDSDDDPDDRPC